MTELIYTPNPLYPTDEEGKSKYLSDELNKLSTHLTKINSLIDTGGVQSVVGGTDITVDDTDPANPVVNYTGSGSGGRTLLQTIDNTVAGEFDFDNIPQTYNRLIVQGEVRSDEAVDVTTMYCDFNLDATNGNYFSQRNSAAGGSSGAPQNSDGAFPEIGVLCGAAGVTGSYGYFEAVIENYSGDKLKQIRSAYTAYEDLGSTIWNGSNSVSHNTMVDAITRLRFKAPNTPTNGILGTLRLYGELFAGSGSGSGGRTLIETITDPVSGEFDFSGIDQSYNKITIEGILRSTATGNSDVIHCFLNTDELPGNYYYQNDYVYTGGASVQADPGPRIGEMAAASSPSYTQMEMAFVEYTGSHRKNTQCSFVGELASSANVIVGALGYQSSVTDAINRIRIRTDGGEDLLGTLRLYGEQ